jgi:parvulin-like peptidyl-prolyl isomerase
LSKRRKKSIPKPAPTKRQLSKWQRQMKIRRIVIIAAAVFLAGILSWVGYGYHQDYKARVEAWREVVLRVGGVPFTMEYYVNMFDAYTKATGVELELIQNMGDYVANMVANYIIEAELLKQGAKNLSIEVIPEEIDARLEEYDFPNDRVYRDMIRAILLQERLEQYFDSGLNATMEQAHVQVVLVESEEVAVEVITEIETGGNFTDLVEEFSRNPAVEGDLGWLPEELMPNTLVADVSFNLTLGEISQPIYDESATKNVGYWLIEVTGKQDGNITARAMLLGSEAEAELVKDELVSANFSSLAKKYSQHESKINGGELGLMKQGDMGSTAFDAVAFNLTVNEVSEPVKDESVQTTGGYWLVKVIERGEHELTPNARERLIDKHLNDWFDELREKSTIENLLNNEKKAWAVSRVLEGR